MLAIAHRGYSSRFPENTRLGFEQAIAAGTDYIETDVRSTRDRALVCLHDPDLARIAGRHGAVTELDLAEIRTIPLPQEQHVMTLDEVLALARHRVPVMLDVKITMDAIAEAILATVQAAGMLDAVMYGARSLDHLDAVRRHSPRIPVMAMPPDPAAVPDWLRHDIQAVRYWEEEVTREGVGRVHAAGRAVWVTMGRRRDGEIPGHATAERVTAMRTLGVDALLLNDPTLVVRERRRHLAQA